MGKKHRTSMSESSIRHWVFAAFALLAILPTLMLVQMGVISNTYSVNLMHDRQQLALLLLFLAGCYVTGLLLLGAMVRQVRRVKALSDRLKHESLPAIEAVFPPDQIPLTEYPPRDSDNELESLTKTLDQIQGEISRVITRVRPQASVFRELRQLLEQLRDMVLMVDANGQVAFSNAAARQTLGILPERALPLALAESRLNDASRQLLTSLLVDSESSTRLNLETEDGHTLTIEPRVRTLAGDATANLHLLVLRDVTDIARMERQLYRTEKLASLGQLISGVAHELNNPLAAVLGFAELCRHSSQSRKELNGNLEIIEREARRTARIVENLLNFSRRRSTSKAACDLHDLLERCFVLLHYQFKMHNIQISRQYCGDLPTVIIDEYQVQQVLMNVLGNACQAMANSAQTQPVLRVTTSIAADGQALTVDIADNGPGIPPALNEQIFEPFFTTKGEEHGTGLGLPISRKIMEEHGGSICLGKPPANFSSCFSLAFPLASHTCERRLPIPHGQATLPTCRGRILVVDDELAILEMIQSGLERLGLTVDAFDSMMQAKGALVTRDYDLAIIDYYMPDGQADQLLQLIDRSVPAMVGRVIVATGDPNLEIKLNDASGQPIPIITKPFHLATLQQLVSDRLKTAAPLAGTQA